MSVADKIGSEMVYYKIYLDFGYRILPHCNENPIYVFLEKELRGPSPNFHIHVSLSDLYIPRIVPHIFLK
jgi:hypothetical protein